MFLPWLCCSKIVGKRGGTAGKREKTGGGGGGSQNPSHIAQPFATKLRSRSTFLRPTGDPRSRRSDKDCSQNAPKFFPVSLCFSLVPPGFAGLSSFPRFSWPLLTIFQPWMSSIVDCDLSKGTSSHINMGDYVCVCARVHACAAAHACVLILLTKPIHVRKRGKDDIFCTVRWTISIHARPLPSRDEAQCATVAHTDMIVLGRAIHKGIGGSRSLQAAQPEALFKSG